jgi:hypothetical protein
LPEKKRLRLAGAFQCASLAAQELLRESGKLIVRKFSLLVKMHLGLGGLPTTPLAFLRYVPLVICHAKSLPTFCNPILFEFSGTTIVAEKEKDARLACVFRSEFG